MLNNRNAMLAGLLANRGRMQPTNRSSMSMLQQPRMQQQTRSPWQTQAVPGYGAFGGLPNPYSVATPATTVSASSYLPGGTSTSLGIDPATLSPSSYTPPSVSGMLNGDQSSGSGSGLNTYTILGKPIEAASENEAWQTYYDIWFPGLEG